MNSNNSSTEVMPSSIVDAQLQRLLQIVGDYQNQQCAELSEQASEQAKQIVRHTYRNARNRLRTNILEDRQQLEQSLASVRAKRHTFVMQQKHQASRIFLDKSWELLHTKLAQRWKDKQQRQMWLKIIVQVALKTLPAKEWLVEHGVDLKQEDQNQITDFIGEESERKVTFQVSPEIAAGICITVGGASVDGTLAGLLRDRVRIESEILAHCTHCIVHSTAKAKE